MVAARLQEYPELINCVMPLPTHERSMSSTLLMVVGASHLLLYALVVLLWVLVWALGYTVVPWMTLTLRGNLASAGNAAAADDGASRVT